MGKYEEALERARQGRPIDEVFPELKKSDEEQLGALHTAAVTLQSDALESLFSSLQPHLVMKYIDADKLIAEVDLRKEIDNWYNTMGIPVTADALRETAHHFYELGLNARGK